MRWLLMLVAVLFLFGSWWASSALWFGLGLAVGVIVAIGAALAFAQVRIEGNAQTDLLTDPEIEALKAAVRRQHCSDEDACLAGGDFSVRDTDERRERHDA